MRLIGLLSDAQETHGYLSHDTLRSLAKRANVPLHPARWSWSRRAPTCWPSPRTWSGSSATSPAASACPAASARRRQWTENL